MTLVILPSNAYYDEPGKVITKITILPIYEKYLLQVLFVCSSDVEHQGCHALELGIQVIIC